MQTHTAHVACGDASMAVHPTSNIFHCLVAKMRSRAHPATARWSPSGHWGAAGALVAALKRRRTWSGRIGLSSPGNIPCRISPPCLSIPSTSSLSASAPSQWEHAPIALLPHLHVGFLAAAPHLGEDFLRVGRLAEDAVEDELSRSGCAGGVGQVEQPVIGPRERRAAARHRRQPHERLE
eukprot:360774-Chlamydomonas_euryale.AAC.3